MNAPMNAPMSPAAEPPATTKAATDPAMAAAADAKLTKEDKQAWQRSMTEVKAALSKLDSTKAYAKLDSLKTAAKTKLQREQLERMNEVTGFIKDVRDAMVGAIGKLSGADTFRIGTSTEAAFVEGDDKHIVVRVAGERRAYLLEDMPVGMGEALLDLKLDVAHANSLARKGAYILLHPKNTQAMGRGKSMLAEAAAAGAISAELARFYEDDYSLAQLP